MAIPTNDQEARCWSLSDEELQALLADFLKTEATPGTPEAEARQLACWDIQYAVEDNCEVGWRLVELACRAPLTEREMAVVAASVLEDLLAHHGDAVFERLEVSARRDEKMRLMLAMVWQGLMDMAMWGRVQSLRARLSITPQ